jgi:hypothetical protein
MQRNSAMGMWIELGIFALVLVFAWWQLHDVKKAKAQRMAEEARKNTSAPGPDKNAGS